MEEFREKLISCGRGQRWAKAQDLSGIRRNVGKGRILRESVPKSQWGPDKDEMGAEIGVSGEKH